VLTKKQSSEKMHFSITALVLVAVIKSQFAGAWLEYARHRKSPLLSMDKL